LDSVSVREPRGYGGGEQTTENSEHDHKKDFSDGDDARGSHARNPTTFKYSPDFTRYSVVGLPRWLMSHGQS
jgi:hypothetical protein